MTYIQRKEEGLAGIETLASATVAAAKVISDPALPEVACQILQLNKLAEGKKLGAPCRKLKLTPAQKKQGIGLHIAQKPLRMAVWARKNPALAIGAAAGTVGLIFGLGYLIGKNR